MNIPSKVRIGSIDYDVELTDETLVLNTQQSLGIIDYDNNKIRIANNIQSEQRQEQTFLHELVHGIVHEFKIDFSADEEDVVDRFADGLQQVIKDNLPNTIKVGDITITDGINLEKVYEEFSKKMSETLEDTNRGIKIGGHPMCGHRYKKYGIARVKNTETYIVYKYDDMNPASIKIIPIDEHGMNAQMIPRDSFNDNYEIE